VWLRSNGFRKINKFRDEKRIKSLQNLVLLKQTVNPTSEKEARVWGVGVNQIKGLSNI